MFNGIQFTHWIKKNILSLLFFTASCLATYQNLVLRSQINRLNEELSNSSKHNQELHESENSHRNASQLEGMKVKDVIVSNNLNSRSNLSELVRTSAYTVLILEPPVSPCTSCLEMALESWKEKKESIQKQNRPNLLIISARESKRALYLSRELKLEQSCYIDSLGELQTSLSRLGSVSIAVFLNRSGVVIYSTALKSKDPRLCEDFMDKVSRFCTNL